MINRTKSLSNCMVVCYYNGAPRDEALSNLRMEPRSLNDTKNCVIQTVCNILSTPAFERFTVYDLSSKSKLDILTIYTEIGFMEDVYKTVFDEVILKNVTENSETFEDVINNFINYVSENKTFCLNLYKQTEEVIRFKKVIELLNDLILNYCENTDSKERLSLIVGYIRIFQQWSTERYYILSNEVIEEIRKQLLLNHRAILA